MILLRVITFKVDDILITEIDKLANSLGISRSEVIRKALIEYLRTRKNSLISSTRELNIRKITLT